jgi:thiamine biosynthesis protein ThiS
LSVSENIDIDVNGSPRSVRRESTLRDLILELRLVPQQVAVEVNGKLVPRAEHAGHRLNAGDQVEIVTLVGGG